jgi:hypothetical protein
MSPDMPGGLARSRWWLLPRPPGTADARCFPSGDELFEQLDGRFVRVGPAGWRIEIYSVLADDLRWIQLSLRGPSDHMLILRLPLAAGALDVLGEIEDWLRDPQSVPHASITPVEDWLPATTSIH